MMMMMMRRCAQVFSLVWVVFGAAVASAGLSADDVRNNIERLDKAKRGIVTLSVPEVLNEVAVIADYFFLQRADIVSGASKLLGIDISTATSLTVSDRGEVVVRGGKVIPGHFKGSQDHNGVKVYGTFEGSEEVAYGDFVAEWAGAAMRTTSLSALKRAIDGKSRFKQRMARKQQFKELIDKAIATVSGDIHVVMSDRLLRELEGLVGERPKGGVLNVAFPDGKVRIDAKVFISDSGATKLAEALESVTTKLAGQFVGEALETLQGANSTLAGVLTFFKGPIQKLVAVMRDLKVKVETGAAVMNLTVDRRTLHAIFIAGAVVSTGLFVMSEKRAMQKMPSDVRPRPAPAPPPAGAKPGEVVTPSTKDGPEKP